MTGGPEFSDDSIDTNGPPAPAEGLPGRIGRYLVLELLGEGSFGRVFKARDPLLDRVVALKVPHRHRVAGPEDVDRYIGEGRIVADLHHPGIIPVLDADRTDDGLCYVASQYVEGEDLARRVARGERPDCRRAAELIAEAAEALDLAHGQGIYHRDIKPGNLLLGDSGRLYVTDFGLALRDQDVLDGPDTAGTLAYMSPEQLCGRPLDGRTDIFSLGVVFFELMTHRRPFRGRSARAIRDQILRDDPSPPHQIVGKIPRELSRICLKALAKSPAGRYETAGEMADDLRAFLAAGSTSGLDPTDRPKAVPLASRLAVGVLVVLAIATPIVLIGRPRRSSELVVSVATPDPDAPLSKGMPPERRLRYVEDRSGGLLRIDYAMPYLDAYRAGGTVEGVEDERKPFACDFPRLSLRLLNRSSEPILPAEAVLEVTGSRVDARPLLIVLDRVIGKLVFFNEGWGEVGDPVEVRFRFESAGAAIDPEIVRPAIRRADGGLEVPIVADVPPGLEDEDEVTVVGRVAYGATGPRESIGFRTRVVLPMRATRAIPPSWTYPDVQLQAGRLGRRTVSLSNLSELKPGESEYVVIPVASDRTASYRLTLTVNDGGGREIGRQEIELGIFVPRTAVHEPHAPGH